MSVHQKMQPLLQGWSAFAAEPIAAGRFVCQYAGELLSSAETRQRLSEYDTKADGPGHALLVSRTPSFTSPKLHSFSLLCTFADQGPRVR